MGLAGQDAVYPLALGGPAPGRAARCAGRAASGAWPAGCRRSAPRASTLAAALGRLATSGSSRPGLFVCLTDGLDPGAPEALRELAARGHELALVQVLSPIELDPDLEGDLRLLDAESGDAVEVTAHAQTLRQYKENLAAHCRLLEETTLRAGGRFVQSVVGQPLSAWVSQGLRRVGLVR